MQETLKGKPLRGVLITAMQCCNESDNAIIKELLTHTESFELEEVLNLFPHLTARLTPICRRAIARDFEMRTMLKKLV